MIAKVAYSTAAATGALALLKEPSPIRGVILGSNTHVGDYVGTLTYPLEAHDGQLHRVIIFPDFGMGQLIADVQLFSDSHAPRYGVLLGELSNDASQQFTQAGARHGSLVNDFLCPTNACANQLGRQD
jgi:hypothetical protein